ncbi:MAG: insulinase family protein [Alicyclobacillus sp.]|nr:insulinase family protein [Alicyclobacillus sp.]
MTDFQTVRRGRLAVHVLHAPRFQTRHVSVRLVRPITREEVTASALLPYLWMEGTTRYPSAEALQRRADDLYGAVLRTGIGKRADRHVLESYAAVPEEVSLGQTEGLLDEAVDLALDLMADPLREGAAFPARHVEREKVLHRRRIESTFDDKVAYAFERCVEEVCRGDAAGLSRLGYAEDLAALDGAKLWQTHVNALREAELHAYVVGGAQDAGALADALLQRLEQRLPEARAEAAGTAVQPVPVGALAPRGGEVNRVTDRQNVAQGKLDLGFRTGVSYHSDDYPALLVCNGVLGGFPHSKLFVNVREKASLAYYASSRLDALTGVVVIQTGIEIERQEKALSIILDQVKALQDGQVSDDELEWTRRSLRNQYLQLMDQPTSIAEVHFLGGLAGRVRSIPELLEAVEAVDKADVVRAAGRLQLDTVYFLRNQEVRAGA